MNYNTAKYKASYGTPAQLPEPTNMEIAFSGRSNVGKSSLLNKLFARKALVKVSSKPGKTSTINFFDVENLYFVDLPGYGYAKASASELRRWSELINAYFDQKRNLVLVVALVDIRHAASKLDEQMIQMLKELELDFVVIATKADKLSNMQRQKQIASLKKQLDLKGDLSIIACSSETGLGIDDLKRRIQLAI